MPTQPPKPCRKAACGALTENGYCEAHKQEKRKGFRELDRKRENSHKRGYNKRWERARKFFLRRNPICIECKRRDVITLANVVDHIKPHKGDKKLFWNELNWRALCSACHNKKSAREGNQARNENR
jgi:5-methylcytosine-specific restriction enzyme A